MAETRRVILLLGAVFLPVLYFGVQLVLAPTFPNYDVMTDAASLLGSDLSPYAIVFNVVAILSGVCGIAGALGLFAALRADRCPMVLNILILAAVLVAAAGCIWAGVFPLPDPRHRANPTGPALLALSLLFAVAAFAVPKLRPWRAYFVLNLVCMGSLVLALSGVLPLDRAQYGGLLQRLVAFTGLGPIGIVGVIFLRKSI